MKKLNFLFTTLILCIWGISCTSNEDLEDERIEDNQICENNEIFYTTKYGYMLEKDFIDIVGFGDGITKCIEHNYENGYGYLKFSNDVTKIPREAFRGCSSLQTMYLPKTIVEIGNVAFSGCNELVELDIPDCVERIGYDAFFNCTGLINIKLPSKLTKIDDFAFYNCSSLTNVVIPDSVVYIGIESFRKCTGLSSVIIPNTVTVIGCGAFSGCTNLADIYCESTTPPTIYFSDGYNYLPFPKSANIYVPKGALELYKTSEVWNFYPNIKTIDN